MISREGASRKLDVTCNVAGRDLAAVASDIEAAVRDNIQFKTGYHPEFLGEYAEAKSITPTLAIALTRQHPRDHDHPLHRL